MYLGKSISRKIIFWKNYYYYFQIRFCLDLVELQNKFKREWFPTKLEPKKLLLNNLIWRKKNKISPNNPEEHHFSEEEKIKVDIIEGANHWVFFFKDNFIDFIKLEFWWYNFTRKRKLYSMYKKNFQVKIIGKIWFGQNHIQNFQHMKEYLWDILDFQDLWLFLARSLIWLEKDFWEISQENLLHHVSL